MNSEQDRLKQQLDELRRENQRLHQQLRFSQQFFEAHAVEQKARLRAADGLRLQALRDDPTYARAFTGEAKISIIVPTYNRAELLIERTIPSVLAQTYSNWELIIVGDQMSAEQAAALTKAAAGDSRIRFHNLKRRGRYPALDGPRWYVAGIKPINYGMRIAQGQWIAHLDDDDLFLPDHLATLLGTAQRERAEWVHAKVLFRTDDGRDQCVVGGEHPAHGGISRISSLYHAGLKTFRYNPNCWRYCVPGDWDLWERLLSMGVRYTHVDAVTAIHFGDYFGAVNRVSESPGEARSAGGRRLAVVLHMYYPEYWPEFKAALQALPSETRLFVTTVPAQAETVRLLVRADFPQAEVFVYDNRGRDVGPLFELLDRVPLEDYDLVLKLHTKKSPHMQGGGEAWRQYALQQLLPAGRLNDVLRFFDEHPEVGLAGPEGWLFDVQADSGQTNNTALALKHWAAALGFNADRLDYHFIAGTMFWARGAVFKELRRLGVRQADFEAEAGQLDGTLAHVLERIFPLLARKVGLETAALVLETHSLDNWLNTRRPSENETRLIAAYLQQHAGGSRFAIAVLDLHGDAPKLAQTLESLGETLYRELAIVVLSASPSLARTVAGALPVLSVAPGELALRLNELLEGGDFDWLMQVRAGETFTASGLQMVALELLAAGAQTGVRAVYGDGLVCSADGGLSALFRPGFNLDYLLSFPAGMAGHWLLRRDILLEAGGFDSASGDAFELDMLLRLIERGGLDGLAHIDEPLVITAAPILQDSPDEGAAILRHLTRRGYQAQLLPYLPGRYRIHYGHQAQPLVSIIIPTKDQLPMLQRCVESLLEKTRYPHYELLIVDNNSETPEACEWLAGVEALADDKVRVLRYPQPFNYAAINNMAVGQARGEYLVLLNNDTAIIREDWLDELLNHAQRPEVGIVGAKLLYPDGRIQHAGVVLGLRGPADHPFIGEAMDAPGYMQRLQVDQNYSAVTAACLMIRKSVYEQVEGMDEQAFKVSYNDVDLCLKVGAAGYLNVWTPHAVLLHEGSVSQKKVDSASAQAKRERFIAEQDAMYAKWLPTLASDPAYNRNLSLNAKGFELEPDPGLTWRPLSWRPLPVVLAHPADPWGCGNYRIIKPFEALRDAALVDGMLSDGLLHVVDLQRYDPDVIVLQRQIGDERLEAMRRIKQFSRAFKVYELDDYLPNLPIKSVHRDQMPRDILKSLRRGLSYVDRFVVSTAPLAEALSGFHPDIRVIENRLPVDWWQGLSSRRQRGRKPRVGWAGGIGHTGDLELIADVIRELAGEVEWVFFGMCPEKIRPYVQEVHVGVDIAGYSAALAALDLDLALAPVEQNLFNDCKSNLRLLEYGACGFPVICSDVLCYRGDLPVTRVKNRFKDWVDAIRMHINDLDATARMGDELRAQVMDKWMLQAGNVDAWRAAWLPD